jgi:UDP-glucose 4-epimerase
VKVAVTGASGFIGRSLLAALESAGHDSVALDLRASRFTGAEVVVHLAAVAHRRASREELDRVNVELTRDIGKAAVAHGSALVFLSSVKVHGEMSAAPLTESSPLAPQDPYGESKARAEEALRAIPGLRLAVLRAPLVYGPGVKANFLALMHAIARGIPLPLASVQNRRSLVYVGNLVDAVVRCLGKDATYLVSDETVGSTADLCVQLGDALRRPARLFRFPAAWLPAKLAASLEVDDSTIRKALAWRPPHTRREGLLATARWYQGR